MIRIKLDGIPPSVNAAYANGRGGRRVLTTAGKSYKTLTANHIVRFHPADIRGIKKDYAYGLGVTLHMGIFNSGWPDKAKTRYKKLDVSNRIKLLEDALVNALGIDDCQFTVIIAQKVHNEIQSTVVTLWDPTRENPQNDRLR